MKRLYFKDRAALRAWLGEHHQSPDSIWIEYYKDGTPGIGYRESLEEALCFGWIDSLINKIDDRIYVRKFSPRSPTSNWSALNKKLVAELTAAGLMMPPGLAKIEAAKRNGHWDAQPQPAAETTLAQVAELQRILGGNNEMSALFAGKGEKARQLLARYYFAAKNEETRRRRLERMAALMRGEIQIL